MCIVSERIPVKDKATCLRSLKKKSEKKEKYTKQNLHEWKEAS